MYYKRNEAFRYTFDDTIPGSFIKKTDRFVAGPIELINLSVSGVKIELDYFSELSTDDDLLIQFSLQNQQIDVDGEIVWVKNLGKRMTAGVQLHTTEEMKQMIVHALKLYTKQNRAE
ncbi:PilZ domain-containing protein [Thalassobacillus pellis]|uniref:PilZ domain-containing protein n=1 Tax=Thalassobacillus pellis TaxID=748008 RepID=UPI00195F7A46|nr:PilZ domain-containing protein [Thalassobacillus pellis]MBM7551723.1 hypothetical protein [Thalassobacillus pellis]